MKWIEIFFMSSLLIICQLERYARWTDPTPLDNKLLGIFLERFYQINGGVKLRPFSPVHKYMQLKNSTLQLVIGGGGVLPINIYRHTDSDIKP